MTRFYLVRHGESAWNADLNRYCGRSDIPLSLKGEEQAEEAALGLADCDFSVIYSSPLVRALQTAKPHGERRGLPIHQDPRLTEIDFGKWEGVPGDEIRALHADAWQAWTTDPSCASAGETGESAAQVYERALDFFAEKTRQHPDESVLVVCHNTLIRVFIAGMLEMPFRSYRKLVVHNGSVTVIDSSENGFFLRHLNCLSGRMV